MSQGHEDVHTHSHQWKSEVWDLVRNYPGKYLWPLTTEIFKLTTFMLDLLHVYNVVLYNNSIMPHVEGLELTYGKVF